MKRALTADFFFQFYENRATCYSLEHGLSSFILTNDAGSSQLTATRHVQVSPAIENTRQWISSPQIGVLYVWSYFTVNETNWRVLRGCYDGWKFMSWLEWLLPFSLWVCVFRSIVCHCEGCDRCFVWKPSSTGFFFFFALIFSIWYFWFGLLSFAVIESTLA